MYVIVSRSGKNKKNAYVKLVEAYRNEKGKKRTETIKTIGRLDELQKKDPNILQKLKAKYSNEREGKKKATALARLQSVQQILSLNEAPEGGYSETPAPLLHYGHYLLRQIWDDDLALSQKIDYLQKSSGLRSQFKFNEVIRHLAALKVMDPSSVLFSYGHKDDFLGDPWRDISLDNCYESLSFLKENKDEIFRWINKKMDAKFGKNRATMVFYDVTNAYFETPLTDAESDNEQVDFCERVQQAAEGMLGEGLISADCFDDEGNVCPELLPESFWETDAHDRLQYLRMRGPSKEHRADLPLVSVALVIDKNGIPMDFEVYAGNASEFKTMRPSIDKLKKKYDITDAIVVADRGLNSVSNLKMLAEFGLGFIVAQKVTNLGSDLTKEMLDLSKYTAFNSEKPSDGLYRAIPNWKKTDSKGASVDCMLVLTYNEKRKQRDDKILDALVEIVKRKAAAGVKLGQSKNGWAALALTDDTKGHPILGVNEKVLARKRLFSGFAAIAYDDSPETRKKLASENKDAKEPARTLCARDVAAQYPRLNRIEDAFRIMKSNLGLRPMYVRTSDHIRGHVTVCFLSLLILRLLQYRLEEKRTPLSIREICSSLSGASVAAVKIGKQVVFCHTGYQANVRKGYESMKTPELLEKIKAGKIKTSHIPDLMRACNLEPIPQLCSLQELGTSLRTRFVKVEKAIPEVRLATL